MNWDRTVFIAYAREDARHVRDIYDHLCRHGIEAWLDTEALQPGADWDREIREAIRLSRFFLACVSRRSLTKTGYVQRELRIAMEAFEEKPAGTTYLIPALLEETEIPNVRIGTIHFNNYQCVRLYEESALCRLIAMLHRELGAQSDGAFAQIRADLAGNLVGDAIIEKLEQFQRETNALVVLSEEERKAGNLEAAFKHLETAYKINNTSEIAAALANRYARGQGVGANIEKAIGLCMPGVASGCVKSMTTLGAIYLDHFTNDAELQASAIRLLSESANRGDLEAKAVLSLAYAEGKGVPRDLKYARSLLEQAGDGGNVEAQSTLIFLYSNGGLGYEKNQTEAVRWARRAAAAGDGPAIEFLRDYAERVRSRFNGETGGA
jgi:TPR repeat protein